MSDPSGAVARLPHSFVVAPAALTFEDFFDAESPVLFRRLCLVTGDQAGVQVAVEAILGRA